jgi:hypothetical protein
MSWEVTAGKEMKKEGAEEERRRASQTATTTPCRTTVSFCRVAADGPRRRARGAFR